MKYMVVCACDVSGRLHFYMPVRGVGIRDISDIEETGINKVLTVLVRSSHKIKPEQMCFGRAKL